MQDISANIYELNMPVIRRNFRNLNSPAGSQVHQVQVLSPVSQDSHHGGQSAPSTSNQSVRQAFTGDRSEPSTHQLGTWSDELQMHLQLCTRDFNQLRSIVARQGDSAQQALHHLAMLELKHNMAVEYTEHLRQALHRMESQLDEPTSGTPLD